jgi:3-hydroxyisobutyrate dehydrogenase-like beta-hydroxyacid dehydrogenase
MNQKITRLGFIGVGRMGKPMAINLLKSGYDLAVYDVQQEPLRELAKFGAKVAQSPKELAAISELIEVAVVDDAQVQEVLLGADGVFEGAEPETIIAVHSTVNPEMVKSLAAKFIVKKTHVLDAPISGGETGAREKSLCYMVGGEASLLERCREFFKTSASDIFYLGPLGSGAAAKMIVQVVTCINMLAASEAERLADEGELNFPALQKVLHASSGQSFVADHWIDRFKLSEDSMDIRRRRTEVFQKSLAPALEMAERLGFSLPGAALAQRLLPSIMGIEK